MPFIHKIPKCPRCGGISTGRYVITEPDNVTEYLRHGEIIRACKSVPSNNLFCDECGFEWCGAAKFTYISREDFKYRQCELSVDENVILKKEQEMLGQKKDKAKRCGILRFAGRIFTKMLAVFIIVPYRLIVRDIVGLFKKTDKYHRKGF